MTDFVQSSTMLKMCSIVVLSLMMLAFSGLFCYLVVIGQIQTALALSGPLTFGLGGIFTVLGVHLGAATSNGATPANKSGGQP